MLFDILDSPRRIVSLKKNEPLTGLDLLKESCPQDYVSDFYIVCNGRKVDEDSILEDGKNYHIVPRLVGGKGGFGSMLRAIGAQIEKTTSREACRDLSGRRMRDINNEKKLKDWLAKEGDREKEKEERRAEKRQRQLNKRHKFEDKVYHQQKEKVAGDLEEALQTGLKKSHRKEETNGPGPSKKPKMSSKEWLGMDLDSDDLDSESDTEACPGIPDSQASVSGTSDSDSGDMSARSKPSSSTDEGPSSSKSTNDSTRKPHNSLLSQLPPPSANTTDSNSEQTSTDSKSKHSGIDVVDTDATKEPEVDSRTPVDLDLFTSSEELAGLGLERLKVALMTRGLKCGGTLAERAGRLFSVKGLREEEVDPALRAKGKGKKSK